MDHSNRARRIIAPFLFAWFASLGALAAGAFVASAPALAQTGCATPTSAQEHICNLDRTTATATAIVSSTQGVTQSFTTGGNGPYTVDTVRIRFDSVTGDIPGAVANIYGHDTTPTTIVGSLTPDSGGFRAGVVEFTASGITLTSNTRYHLVVEMGATDTGMIRMARTESTTEATASPGWTLGGRGLRDGLTWNTSQSRPHTHQFGVVATAANPATPTTTVAAPTGVTVAPGPQEGTLSWTVGTPTTGERAATSFEVCAYRNSPAGAFDGAQCTDGRVRAVTGATTNMALINSGLSQLAHWFAVRGVDGSDTSAWMPVAAAVALPVNVRAPTNVVVTASTDNSGSITVTWGTPTMGSGNEDPGHYQTCAVLQSASFPSSGALTTCAASTESGNAATRAHTLTGLTVDTAYKVAVRPLGGNGHLGAWTPSGGAVVTPLAAPPAESSDATLSALMLSGGTLSPSFAPATTTYTASVPNTVSSTTVTATPNDDGASVSEIARDGTAISGTTVALAEGANVVTVEVTAEDGSTQTYTVTVTRADATVPSTPTEQDNQPRSVMLMPGDDSEVTVTWQQPGLVEAMLPEADDFTGYAVCVHAGTAFNEALCTPTVAATAGSVSGTSTSSGVGIATIGTVVGTTHERTGLMNGVTYIARVRATYGTADDSAWVPATPETARPGIHAPGAFTIPDRDEIPPRTAANSTEIPITLINYAVDFTIEGGTLLVRGASEDTATEATPGTDKIEAGDRIRVRVMVGGCGPSGARTATITIGEGDPVTYTATPRDCDMDTTLSDLQLDGTQIAGFAASTTAYNENVDKDDAEISVTATATDDTARVTINGVSDDDMPDDVTHDVSLNPGANTITVRVTAENGDTGSYTITVRRTAPPTNVNRSEAGDTLTVRWSAPSGGATGYEGFEICVYQSDDAAIDFMRCTGGAIQMVDETTFSYDHDITAGRNYHAAVRSIGTGVGDESDWVEATGDTAGGAAAATTPAITRAMMDMVNSAIAERIEQARVGGGALSLNLAQTASEIIVSQGAVLQEGGDLGRSMKGMLDGKVIALSAKGGGAGVSAPTFWVSGDYTNLRGDNDDTEYDGEVVGIQLGADARMANGALLGAAVARSESDTDYEFTDGGSGEQQLTLNSIHPYLGWRTDGNDMWASIAYGEGELETTPDGSDTTSNDVDLGGASVGLSIRFGEGARINGEISAAQLTIDGVGADDSDIEVDAHRVRFGSQWSSTRAYNGGTLRRALEAGVRHDSGDGTTGGGIETGYRVDYRTDRQTASGFARVLLAHGDDLREWGVGAMLAHAPGADGQGFSARMEPSWGATQSRTEALLNGDIDQLANSVAAPAPGGRMEGEIGYGFAYREGLMTPFGGFTLTDASANYRIGTQYKLRTAPLTMGLEAFRNERDVAETGVRLKAGINW